MTTDEEKVNYLWFVSITIIIIVGIACYQSVASTQKPTGNNHQFDITLESGTHVYAYDCYDDSTAFKNASMLICNSENGILKYQMTEIKSWGLDRQ